MKEQIIELINLYTAVELAEMIRAKDKEIEYKNEEIEKIKNSLEYRNIPNEGESVSTSFERYRKLKSDSNNWELIKWAIENEIKFIAVPHDKDKPWATHINNDDIEFLKKLRLENEVTHENRNNA